MMNLVAICFLVTSMAFAGILSPSPQSPVVQNPNQGGEHDQVIVKGGHRAVLVEYADSTGQGNTRVCIISPPSSIGGPRDMLSAATAAVAGVAEDVEGKLKDAVCTSSTRDGHGTSGPGEVIFDAFGKCKHKIANAMIRAKEKVAETAHEVEEEAKDVVGGAIDKAKHVSEVLVEKSAKTTPEDVASDSSSAAWSTAAEKAEEVWEKAKGASEVFVEKPKRKGEEVLEAVAGTTRKAEEKMRETIGRAGKKELSDIAMRGREVVFDAVCYLVSQESIESLMGVVQLLGFATAYGTTVWVTFVMSYVLAETLPRQQFGMVQSKIYPVYFRAVAIGVGVALLGHLLGQRSRALSRKPEMLQLYNLLASLLLVFINLLIFEPRATKVMFDRMKVEKEEGRGREGMAQPTRVMDTTFAEAAGPGAPAAPGTGTHAVAPHPALTRGQEEARAKLETLNNRLKKLNMYSSLLNLMTLMGLSWHLVYISASGSGYRPSN
ncbi:hypothetical protein Dimus_006738 [Dionaea muscipula]